MRVLIDTHALLWAVNEPDRLGAMASAALLDPGNQLLLSAASVWEMAIKVGLKKLALVLPYRQWISRAIGDLSLSLLPITVEYADIQAGLPFHHRDPFDRLIIAQAMAENLPIITADGLFDAYGVKRIWN